MERDVLMKLIYHPNLYLGESLTYGDMIKIKLLFNIQPKKADIFLITRSMNENDQLDIFHAKYLQQRYYTERPVYVFGMAKNKEEAMSFLEDNLQCIPKAGHPYYDHGYRLLF